MKNCLSPSLWVCLFNVYSFLCFPSLFPPSVLCLVVFVDSFVSAHCSHVKSALKHSFVHNHSSLLCLIMVLCRWKHKTVFVRFCSHCGSWSRSEHAAHSLRTCVLFFGNLAILTCLQRSMMVHWATRWKSYTSSLYLACSCPLCAGKRFQEVLNYRFSFCLLRSRTPWVLWTKLPRRSCADSFPKKVAELFSFILTCLYLSGLLSLWKTFCFTYI